MKIFVYPAHYRYKGGFECLYYTLSALFDLWLLGGTNCYLIFIVVIFIFKAVDTLLSMKWKPGCVPRLFKSSVKDVKALIISL